MNNNYEDFKNMSCNSFIEYLLTLSPNELTLLATAIGFLLSFNLDYNKQNSLGNFFELLGQVILTISAQNQTLDNRPDTNDLQKQINYLKNEIERLKKSNS